MTEINQFTTPFDTDFPVTRFFAGLAGFRLANWRSYRQVVENRPNQSFQTWKCDDRKVVFAFTAAAEGTFAGDFAARFLGERLVDWLWCLPELTDDTLDGIKAQLAYQLTGWADFAQEQVLALPLPAGLSEQEQNEKEAIRQTSGSESMFACGRIEPAQDGTWQLVIAWGGDIYLRCFDRKDQPVQFDPVRSPANRWSTILGMRGSLSFARLNAQSQVSRLLLFTNSLAKFHDELPVMADEELQAVIVQRFLTSASEDMAYFEIALESREEITSGEESGYRVDLPGVTLEAREEAVFGELQLEWTLLPGALYSLVEGWVDDGDRKIVYAGPENRWKVPAGSRFMRYRVRVVTPEGWGDSDWLECAGERTAEQDWLERVEAGSEDAVVDLDGSEIEPEIAASDVYTSAYLEQATSEGNEPDLLLETPGGTEIPFEQQPDPPETGEAEDTGEDPAHEANATGDLSQSGTVLFAEVEPVELPGSDRSTAEPVIAESPGETSEPGENLPSTKTLPVALLNLRVVRGEQMGDYVLEWDAVPQVPDYEVRSIYLETEQYHLVRGHKDTIRNPQAGMHQYWVRPVYPGPREQWNEQNSTLLNVPEGISVAPGGVSLAQNADGEICLTWEALPEDLADEYWIYEVSGKKPAHLARVPAGEPHQYCFQPKGRSQRQRYVVRGMNWTGLGPESGLVELEPAQKQEKGGLRQWFERFRRAEAAPQSVPSEGNAAERETVVVCSTFYDLCSEITRHMKKIGMKMERLRLEQRMGDSDEYRSVDSRQTTELISLNFVKGPDHRLTIMGTKGEILVIFITFDRMKWNMSVRFTPVVHR